MNKIIRDVKLITNKIINGVNYHSNGYIVFGEWMGKRVNDNSYYLANYMALHYPDAKLCWIAEADTDLSCLNSSIKHLIKDSSEANDMVSNALVLVMNQGYTDFSSNPSFNVSGPLTVNLWHGIMWKKIGFDAIEGKSILHNLEYKFQIIMHKSDLYLAPSREYQRIYKSAFFLSDKAFIQAGQPRNSLFYNNDRVSNCRKQFCDKYNVDSSAKIIAYLPTFRDSGGACFSFYGVCDNSFWSMLEEKNIVIVCKSHFADTNLYTPNDENGRVISINDISAQELMAASDILITDYSSCFFDYLILNRPIIHFIYDYDFYKNKDRGLYYDVDQVACGDTPRTLQELIDAIRRNIDNPDSSSAIRNKRKSEYISFENINSCEVISKRIFEEIKKKQDI